MFSRDQYELLDFGDGRKLERFGDSIVDRPAPAAEGLRRGDPSLWAEADHVYDREAARWRSRADAKQTWSILHEQRVFHLSCTDAGQVGVFPEQAVNWDWLAETIVPPLKILNLFAYTGGSTLACAAAGADVVHIDAAQNSVQWARRNAEASSLADRPIRWIAEDAVKFVERELRRGNRYDAVILDPPSYGHGPKGEVWKLADNLLPLLERIARLTQGRRKFILLSCHTPQFEAEILAALLRQTMGAGDISAGELSLATTGGRRLPSGHFARWLPRP
jgi:23S rRNA (cytosine1962-C5)-methyltransferase